MKSDFFFTAVANQKPKVIRQAPKFRHVNEIVTVAIVVLTFVCYFLSTQTMKNGTQKNPKFCCYLSVLKIYRNFDEL